MTKRLFTICAALALAAGCGGSPTQPSGSSSSSSSTPSAPSSAPTTTTSASTETSGVFTFNWPVGMLVADQALIRNAVTTQAAFFQSALGRTITQATTISGSTTDSGCVNGGSSAFSAIARVVICVSNPGWTVHDSLNKQKILMHETFHVLQYEMHWLGHPNQDAASAHWIDEGTAEYMGWRGAANAGLVSFETARQCNVAQAGAQASASQNLSTMETGPGFGIAGSYQLAMLGVDQLAATPGPASLVTYGNAIAANAAWQTAFQTAFGTSTTAFYNQYVAYRTGLGAGANSCGT